MLLSSSAFSAVIVVLSSGEGKKSLPSGVLLAEDANVLPFTGVFNSSCNGSCFSTSMPVSDSIS